MPAIAVYFANVGVDIGIVNVNIAVVDNYFFEINDAFSEIIVCNANVVVDFGNVVVNIDIVGNKFLIANAELITVPPVKASAEWNIKAGAAETMNIKKLSRVPAGLLFCKEYNRSKNI